MPTTEVKEGQVKLYRIYAPYHSIISSGTIEGGIYTDRDAARNRLVEIARTARQTHGGHIEWTSADQFNAVHDDGGLSTVRISFRITEYTADEPRLDVTTGYSCMEV